MSVYDPDNQDLDFVFKDGRVEEVNADWEISVSDEAQENEGRETIEMEANEVGQINDVIEAQEKEGRETIEMA